MGAIYTFQSIDISNSDINPDKLKTKNKKDVENYMYPLKYLSLPQNIISIMIPSIELLF